MSAESASTPPPTLGEVAAPWERILTSSEVLDGHPLTHAPPLMIQTVASYSGTDPSALT